MSNPSTSWEQIGDHARGPLIAVSFGGSCPSGSAGNEFAAAMVEFLRSVVAKTGAPGVVLDLTELDYQFGDSICGLATPLVIAGKGFRPAAIVAIGSTAQALEPLLAPNFLLGTAGIKIFPTREKAREYVELKLLEVIWTVESSGGWLT